MTPTVRWGGLVVFILLCIGAGMLGGVATARGVGDWYKTLAKPHWTPPDQVFGPVWFVLYVLMAVAAWMVWKQGGFKTAALGLILFAVQLVLNVLWSWIFFALREPGWAFVEIVFLWVVILLTTLVFFRQSSIAGLLLVPYLAWVSFAAVLNFAIWRLNAG